MYSGKEALQLVKERFPGKHEKIDHLFSHDEHFSELCLDYFLCRENSGRSITDKTESAWKEEYDVLCIDLENELSYFLAESMQAK